MLIASIQQFALAITFILIPFAAKRYGDRAQQAAESDMRRQGIQTGGHLLFKSGVKFAKTILISVRNVKEE